MRERWQSWDYTLTGTAAALSSCPGTIPSPGLLWLMCNPSPPAAPSHQDVPVARLAQGDVVCREDYLGLSGFMDECFCSTPEHFLVGSPRDESTSPTCIETIFLLESACFPGNGRDWAAGVCAAPSGCSAQGVGWLLFIPTQLQLGTGLPQE